MTAGYEELEIVANNVATAASEYATEIQKLYSKVEELKNAWSGEDNVAYANKVESYKENLQSLGEVLNDYSVFIKNSVNLLKETQSEIASSASGL